jgi:hypothetical protein
VRSEKGREKGRGKRLSADFADLKDFKRERERERERINHLV